MADGNFLALMGLDVQLLTAGASGGLFRAMFARQKAVDAVSSIAAGAVVSNYTAATLVTIIASTELVGLKIALPLLLAGFGSGFFAFLIAEVVSAKFRAKFGSDDNARPPN